MTNLLTEVLKHEVYPAMGCTEPIAVAFCSANAAKLLLPDKVISVNIKMDPGTYKNGLAVALPNTRGEKGNLMAAALGAVMAGPEAGSAIFNDLAASDLTKARAMLRKKAVSITIDYAKKGIYISAEVRSAGHKALCEIKNSHSAVTLLKKDGREIMRKKAGTSAADSPPEAEQANVTGKNSAPYKSVLRKTDFKKLFKEIEAITPAQLAYIKEGVKLNLAASKEGLKIKKVGYYISDLIAKGYIKKDILSTAKLTTAAATDARMAGAPLPVMSSGQSGNQGVVAILVPYLVGKAFKVPEKRILKSIALSHLVNAYIKVYTGELAPICGCAVAAGVGAAVAIVWQRKGANLKAATLAVNNLISDLGGTLCDGAKSGCALKVASSSDSAIRAAYMAINGEGISELEGFIGKTAEETIKNIALISKTGMAKVDRVILEIMSAKNM
ncbi:MAG: hypothetical protein A2X34_00225 [Elusimicrobia bacterium GWC2_51_8]|nr:MAG: hypothetical protein A2X33_06815 [Elusimicrobia bacterium GWA2_51_34]OGR57677.1 MAG: hypothetical protein A2X34_00225 [Elusimicrobia bacterium GWC2_51_8]OGR85946.1 MAG: hypothetical protein A2021_06895 [Elusimicrobia bacterium GWF2_52_66]HAF95438.1 serine dehydratase subunit alpha family protein [Elusimicrobiota bacterium]HCE98100.1 serine dehydratase subunit alpha family protein [Elusimicrobiota bacterium]